MPWDFQYLSDNPNLSMDFLSQHIDQQWDWDYLSNHPNITMDFVEKNIKQGWNLYNLARRLDEFRVEIALCNPARPQHEWDWPPEYLSENHLLTLDTIDQYPDANWEMKYLSRNPLLKSKTQFLNDLRLRHIKALQIQRHWRHCSCNPQFKLAQRILFRFYSS